MVETLIAIVAGIAASMSKPYFILDSREQHKNFSKFISLLGRLIRSIIGRGETEVKYLK